MFFWYFYYNKNNYLQIFTKIFYYFFKFSVQLYIVNFFLIKNHFQTQALNKKCIK